MVGKQTILCTTCVDLSIFVGSEGPTRKRHIVEVFLVFCNRFGVVTLWPLFEFEIGHKSCTG